MCQMLEKSISPTQWNLALQLQGPKQHDMVCSYVILESFGFIVPTLLGDMCKKGQVCHVHAAASIYDHEDCLEKDNHK